MDYRGIAWVARSGYGGSLAMRQFRLFLLLVRYAAFGGRGLPAEDCLIRSSNESRSLIAQTTRAPTAIPNVANGMNKPICLPPSLDYDARNDQAKTNSAQNHQTNPRRMREAALIKNRIERHKHEEQNTNFSKTLPRSSNR